jgi:CheY-like chemotaxis protein
MKQDELQGRPLTILVVEDDPAHAKLMVRCFEDHRIANRVFHVADGETALDYLFRRSAYADPKKSPRPHVILLDLRLPGTDGLEVLHEIKTSDELQKIPVVIVTSSDAKPDIDAAYRHLANSYLVKPLDFERFHKLMTELGFYWLGWNHYPWSEDNT